MQDRGKPETARYDVTSMGNAIVDVLWQAPESAMPTTASTGAA